MAGLATIEMSLSRPPARLVISSHSASVRWSFQSKAGRMTFPLEFKKTDPCICPESPMARTSAPLTLAFLSTPWIVCLVAVHQSSGFCSVQSGFGVKSG